MKTSEKRLLLLMAACLAMPAEAQTYPTKPVRMLVTVAGPIEILARQVAGKLHESLGQPFVVEVMPGAGGAIAAETIARAKPDGYSIMLATSGSQVMRAFLVKNTNYDQINDFSPIGQAGEAVTVLTAHSSLPVSKLEDLIAYAKAHPGKLSYASNGIGTTFHLAGEQMKVLAGVDILHVPYKVGTQAFQDHLGGQIPLSFAVLGQLLPYLKSGKVKILAVTNDDRQRSIPDVPSMREVIPGFQNPPTWMGYFGPRGMSRPLVARLNAEIVKALAPADIRAKFDVMGFPIVTGTPEELWAKVKRDMALTARLVKTAKVEPE